MFDPVAMLNAHPKKSKSLLWRGYRDTEAVLHTPQERSGRVRGVAPGVRQS